MNYLVAPALLLLRIALLSSAPAMSQSRSTPPRPALVAAQEYPLRPGRSTLGWEAQAVGHGHQGTLQFAAGSLLVRQGQVVGGTATVDMTTLTATDITDAKENANFITHLRADDFFGVSRHPRATFVITRVAARAASTPGAPNVTITGHLTIKGQTNPLTFPARADVRGGVATVQGTARVNRTQYGIRYASTSFFKDLGDHAIADDFTLRFSLVAAR